VALGFFQEYRSEKAVERLSQFINKQIIVKRDGKNILLDESLPIELRDELPGHSVSSVQEMGWSALKNGELLLRAAARFEVFLTADQNLQYQQNLRTLPVAVAVLVARSNRIQDLKPLIAGLRSALAVLPPRTLVTVGA